MRRKLVAALIAVTFIVAGCSDDPEPPAPSPTPTPTASPSPSPSPSPEPTPRDVEGMAKVKLSYVGDDQIVNHKRKKKPNQAAIDEAVAAITGWLDGHLTVLQLGDPDIELGNLGVVIPKQLERASGPAQLAALSTDLASPDDLVESATYRFDVAHDGAPQWVRVHVRVVHDDGSEASAVFVFRPHKDGPQLVAFDAEDQGGGA